MRTIPILLAALTLLASVPPGFAALPMPCTVASCLRWSAEPASDEFLASVASPDSTVLYFATGFQGGVVAWGARTAAPLWSAQDPGEDRSNGDAVILAAGDRVYTAGGGARFDGEGRYEPYATVFAYSASEESHLWTNEIAASAPYAVAATVDNVIAGGPVNGEVRLRGLDPDTGEERWGRRLSSPTVSDLTYPVMQLTTTADGARIASANVAAGFTGGLDVAVGVYGAADGGFRWARRIVDVGDHVQVDAITIDESHERVYVALRLPAHALVAAFRLTNGVPIWTTAVPTSGGLGQSQLVVSGADVVYAGEHDPVYATGDSSVRLRRLDGATGTMQWETRLGVGDAQSERVLALAASSDGTAATLVRQRMPTGDIRVDAIRASDGAVLHGAEVLGAFASSGLGASVSPDGHHAHVTSLWRAWTFTVSDLQPPSAPRTLAATAGPLVGQVALSWRAPATDGGDDVATYSITRTGGGVEAEQWIVDGAERTFLDEEAPLAARLTYTVRAVNGLGEGSAATVCARAFPWIDLIPPCTV